MSATCGLNRTVLSAALSVPICRCAQKFCSPTRSSLMSGRLPMHVNQENSATEQPLAGIPADMTTFPEVLKAHGYVTAQVGKWHCGMASPRVIPHGRGFDTSLGFFNFGEDHYTQRRGGQALSAAEPGPTAASARLRARVLHTRQVWVEYLTYTME